MPGFDRQALNSVRAIRRNVDTQNARLWLYLARISRSVIPRVGRKLRHVSRRWLFDPSAPDFRARIGHHLWVAAGTPRLTPAEQGRKFRKLNATVTGHSAQPTITRDTQKSYRPASGNRPVNDTFQMALISPNVPNDVSSSSRFLC
jgi:hypothetical protein